MSKETFIIRCEWVNGTHPCNGEHPITLNKETYDYMLGFIYERNPKLVTEESIPKLKEGFKNMVIEQSKPDYPRFNHFMSVNIEAELFSEYYDKINKDE